MGEESVGFLRLFLAMVILVSGSNVVVAEVFYGVLKISGNKMSLKIQICTG